MGDKAPAPVRGDCGNGNGNGNGNEDIIDVSAQRDLPQLLRLRKTANVKRPIERWVGRQDWTRATEASQGWQAIEDELRLSGWSKARRVLVLRRRIERDIALASKNCGQHEAPEPRVLALSHDEVQDNTQIREYTVLATNASHDTEAIGPLQRDRCDCENGFDALKNPWAWGDWTMQDMHCSQVTVYLARKEPFEGQSDLSVHPI